jgi:pimeloyl-ACP methyl ester carboxylesterase
MPAAGLSLSLPDELLGHSTPRLDITQLGAALRFSGVRLVPRICYLDGERMKMSGQFVRARWRYEQLDDASHWIPLDAPDRLNQLLIEWLTGSETKMSFRRCRRN